MEKREYVLWRWSPKVKHAAGLGNFVNFPNANHFRRGTPMADTFPDDVQHELDPESPLDTIMTDNLYNTDRLVIVSGRLKDFLLARNLKSVEYLPLTILDHKRKPMKEKYFIVHTLDNVDCLDIQASQAKYNPISKRNIDSVKSLVLDPSKIDFEREFFRINGFTGATFVGRELAAAIDEEGFTAIEWQEIGAYGKDV